MLYTELALQAPASRFLRLAGNHHVLAFLDDDSSLFQRSINGIPIIPPQRITEFFDDVDQVLLAIPSLSRSRRRSLVAQLQSQGFQLLQVPSVDDLTSGRAKIDSLRPISIEDLLGRDLVSPDANLLCIAISGSVVLVTGAGGSIGSELSRQIISLSPLKLIILDNSEPSLYAMTINCVSRFPEMFL